MSKRSTKRKFSELTHSFSIAEEEVNKVSSVIQIQNVHARGYKARTTVPVYHPPSPTKSRCALPNEDPALYNLDGAQAADDGPSQCTSSTDALPKRRKGRNQEFSSTVSFSFLSLSSLQFHLTSFQEHDPVLAEWSKHKDFFLAEMLRLEGFRGKDVCCAACLKTGPDLTRCDECEGGELFCGPCCVTMHIRLPYHRIKVCDHRQ